MNLVFLAEVFLFGLLSAQFSIFLSVKEFFSKILNEDVADPVNFS